MEAPTCGTSCNVFACLKHPPDFGFIGLLQIQSSKTPFEGLFKIHSLKPLKTKADTVHRNNTFGIGSMVVEIFKFNAASNY